MIHIGTAWSSLWRRDGRDIAEGLAMSADDALAQAEAVLRRKDEHARGD
jgi:hypothetical protein